MVLSTRITTTKTSLFLAALFSVTKSSAFSPPSTTTRDVKLTPSQLFHHGSCEDIARRRSILSIGSASVTFLPYLSTVLSPANADFAPGGTLLDRPVSVTYGNPEASPSRLKDNSNVLFNQDNYYKFGAAAQWIEPGSTEFPKTVPFSPSQQRYDALKKYGGRVKSSVQGITNIGSILDGGESASQIAEANDPSYNLRALGLLANSFLASENTGTTNELMLARWYINEMYLRIGDVRAALEKGNSSEAKECYGYLKKAMNSYLSLMNRVITSKVGDKFEYL
mmetsp:Transcript_10782/g.22832  ORF Transcript_10782/g.22832 Transcript_10782/m.22832 type:complete len:281 (+) Transcript_10782:50-892(+)